MPKQPANGGLLDSQACLVNSPEVLEEDRLEFLLRHVPDPLVQHGSFRRNKIELGLVPETKRTLEISRVRVIGI